jgi:hypothetical protein
LQQRYVLKALRHTLVGVKKHDRCHVRRTLRVAAAARSGLFEQFCEVLSILSQAASAAHHYEELRRQCDAALAQRGLKRADLPRIAYYELTRDYWRVASTCRFRVRPCRKGGPAALRKGLSNRTADLLAKLGPAGRFGLDWALVRRRAAFRPGSWPAGRSHALYPASTL